MNDEILIFTSFFGSFRTRKINDIKFGDDDFFTGLNFRPHLEMDSINRVSSRGVFIKLMLRDGPIGLSFKQHAQGFFFISTNLKLHTNFLYKSFHIDVSTFILLDSHVLSLSISQRRT